MELSRGKFDEGRILRRTEMDVSPEATFGQLIDKLGQQGADDALHVLSQLDHALTNAVPQSHYREQPSKAPKLQRDAHDVDFATLTAEQVS